MDQSKIDELRGCFERLDNLSATVKREALEKILSAVPDLLNEVEASSAQLNEAQRRVNEALIAVERVRRDGDRLKGRSAVMALALNMAGYEECDDCSAWVADMGDEDEHNLGCTVNEVDEEE